MKTRLKELRKAKGLTLSALAERTGTSNQHISHLENGRRRLTTEWLDKLARELQCHPFDVLEPDVPYLSAQEDFLLRVFRELTPAQKAAIAGAVTELKTESVPDAL
jgi:transcriptional regulator with XRE-family HTH domain